MNRVNNSGWRGMTNTNIFGWSRHAFEKPEFRENFNRLQNELIFVFNFKLITKVSRILINNKKIGEFKQK